MGKSISALGTLLFLLFASIACGKSVASFPNPTYTPKVSVFETNHTVYGFFPRPYTLH